MLFRLVLFFLLITAIELYLIVAVGSYIGIGATIVVLLGISLCGAWLVRSQGFLVLHRIRDELAAGRIPAEQLVDGMLILVGGVLLLIPGFFTDALGLLFLIPATRTFLKRRARRWIERRIDRGTIIVRRH